MARRFFVGGNFKMNPASIEAKKSLVQVLNDGKIDEKTEVVVAPPSIYLLPIKDILRNDIAVAAQNAYYKTSGAFTGEISPSQLHDAGIPWVILGHSERRTLFHETSADIASKTKVALAEGLKVILCIGETLDERNKGITGQVIESQLGEVVKVLQPTDWERVVIAYEPVWAIGTGKVATTEQAQDTHAETRAYIAKAVNDQVAQAIRIIYGGSVNAKNCKELATQLDVDGFLVGGASLKPEFVDIINAKL